MVGDKRGLLGDSLSEFAFTLAQLLVAKDPEAEWGQKSAGTVRASISASLADQGLSPTAAETESESPGGSGRVVVRDPNR